MVQFNVPDIIKGVRLNADQRNEASNESAGEFLTDNDITRIIKVAFKHLYRKIITWDENYFLQSSVLPIAEGAGDTGPQIELPSEFIKMRMLRLKTSKYQRESYIRPITLKQSTRYKEYGGVGDTVELSFIGDPFPGGIDSLTPETPPRALNLPLGSEDYITYFASAQAGHIELNESPWANYANEILDSIEDLVRHRQTSPKIITRISDIFQNECYELSLYYVLFSNYLKLYTKGDWYYGNF